MAGAPAGVWAFLPYGSEALRLIDALPALRVGSDGTEPSRWILDLPSPVLGRIFSLLSVPDAFNFARTSQFFYKQFWFAAESKEQAARIAEHVWEKEQHLTKRVLFARKRWHQVQLRVFPQVERFVLTHGRRTDFRAFGCLFPNVRMIDAHRLDDLTNVSSHSFYPRTSQALACWPQVRQVIGNAAVVPALSTLGKRSCVLRQLYDVGACISPIHPQAVLAPLLFHGERLTRPFVAPWLKAGTVAEDPYYLLDIDGIERLTLALPSESPFAPEPSTWVQVYSDHVPELSEEKNEQRSPSSVGRRFVPYRWAPVFYYDHANVLHARPELIERLPFFRSCKLLDDYHMAARLLPRIMVTSDAQSLEYFIEALIFRLDSGQYENLRRASIGVTLPFFSFHSSTLPVLQELEVYGSAAELFAAILHERRTPDDNTPLEWLERLFYLAPQLQLSILTRERLLRLHFHPREGKPWLQVTEDVSLPLRSLRWEEHDPTSTEN